MIPPLRLKPFCRRSISIMFVCALCMTMFTVESLSFFLSLCCSLLHCISNRIREKSDCLLREWEWNNPNHFFFFSFSFVISEEKKSEEWILNNLVNKSEVAWISIFICSGLNHAYERQRLPFRIHFWLVAGGLWRRFWVYEIQNETFLMFDMQNGPFLN